MAGGVGSRFWPASRENRPKQFLDIIGTGKSLLRETYERFLRITDNDRILIVTNATYKALVSEHLPELPLENILCEPSRNNTAPCIAYTAFRVEAIDPEAPIIIAPSDHVIQKSDSFLTAIQIGVDFVSKRDALVTLGIEPTRPDTGYGYIQFSLDEASAGVYPVTAFREKPDSQTAQQYLDEGGYVWNAGIFIWKAKDILSAFGKHAPQIFETLVEGKGKYANKGEQAFIDEAYPKTESISVDYAIMERADNVFTIPADIGWSDLGTWGSLHAFSTKDNKENVVQGENTIILDSNNNLIRTNDGKLVVIRGLENFIVVDEEDVLMIYPKDQEQEIKALTKDLKNPRFL